MILAATIVSKTPPTLSLACVLVTPTAKATTTFSFILFGTLVCFGVSSAVERTQGSIQKSSHQTCSIHSQCLSVNY